MAENKKKKILFVITKSNFGGAQRYVYELATSLPREHFDVLVAFGGNGLLKTRLEEAGIRTYTIKSFERDINIRKEIQSMGELSRLIRDERPEIVHLNSSKAGGTGAFIARLQKVPRIVFTAHGWPFYENRSRVWRFVVWMFSYLTTLFAHSVIVVSKHDDRNACMFGMRKKISVIHTALPPILFENREAARETLFTRESIAQHQKDVWLVSTSEHTQNKNIHALVHALAQLKKNGTTNIFLTLMGTGELHTALKEEVVRLGIADQVHFAGFIPEARTYLQAFDIFVMPSLKEGFPYSLLEAGAAGLPVIASNVGGIPEIIEDGVTGILTNPQIPETLPTAIQHLCATSEQWSGMGQTLRAHIENHYTLANMIEKTRTVYESGSETA